MNRTPVLSERLKTIADLVIPGKPMADIGTDHGHLPMWCLENGVVPFAVLSDINPRDSWRASKAFRQHIAVEMAKRALIESIHRAGGEIK